MSENSFIDPHQVFADQFEPDGQNFLYRMSMKGPPVRVTQAERDRFVDSYARFYNRSSWALMAAMSVLVGLWILHAVLSNEEPSFWLFGLGMAPLFLVYMAVHGWAWRAPGRELRGRPVLGETRSGAEVRLVILKRTTYGQFLFVVGAMGALLLKVGSKQDLFAGWNRLWLVFAGFIAVVVGIQAFRKWRHESLGADK